MPRGQAYQPTRSLWAIRPRKRFRRSLLDAVAESTYWIPMSAGAVLRGRVIQSPSERVSWQSLRDDAPHVVAKDNARLKEGGQVSRSLTLPLFIDSSRLSEWRACNRKFFWSAVSQLYPSGVSWHLLCGGAVAAGCEAARKFVFSQPDPATVPHSAIQMAAWPAYLAGWEGTDPPVDQPYLAKNIHNGWASLDAYLEDYHPGRDPVQPYRRADGSPAVEYRYAIPLPIPHPETGDPILFVGRFDVFGLYSFGGAQIPVVLDEKTNGGFGTNWVDQWDMRGQFMGYIWALQQQGYNINHAVVRGIAILKTKTEHKSALIHFPQHLINRWEKQMLRDVTAIVEEYKKFKALEAQGHDPLSLLENVFPQDFASACESYGGCAYKPLCTAFDPYDFTSNYRNYLWSPLEPNPVKD